MDGRMDAHMLKCFYVSQFYMYTSDGYWSNQIWCRYTMPFHGDLATSNKWPCLTGDDPPKYATSKRGTCLAETWQAGGWPVCGGQRSAVWRLPSSDGSVRCVPHLTSVGIEPQESPIPWESASWNGSNIVLYAIMSIVSNHWVHCRN